MTDTICGQLRNFKNTPTRCRLICLAGLLTTSALALVIVICEVARSPSPVAYIGGDGATAPPLSDRELLDNFCTVSVSFV